MKADPDGWIRDGEGNIIGGVFDGIPLFPEADPITGIDPLPLQNTVPDGTGIPYIPLPEHLDTNPAGSNDNWYLISLSNPHSGPSSGYATGFAHNADNPSGGGSRSIINISNSYERTFNYDGLSGWDFSYFTDSKGSRTIYRTFINIRTRTSKDGSVRVAVTANTYGSINQDQDDVNYITTINIYNNLDHFGEFYLTNDKSSILASDPSYRSLGITRFNIVNPGVITIYFKTQYWLTVPGAGLPGPSYERTIQLTPNLP